MVMVRTAAKVKAASSVLVGAAELFRKPLIIVKFYERAVTRDSRGTAHAVSLIRGRSPRMLYGVSFPTHT